MNQIVTLLIVDDDEIIREGLVRNIPWEENGFTVIGTARNGKEGLELAQDSHPHLILSDIRMPFMDGLEMAEAIKAIDSTAKVIFLTGYDEFEYAKKALNLKATDYILKYADNEEILDAVIKAGVEWHKEHQLQGIFDRSQQVLKDKFLRELLFAEEASPEPPTPTEGLNLNLQGDQFSVAILGLEVVDGGEMVLQGDSLNGLCKDLLDKSKVSYELIPDQKKIVLVFGASQDGLAPAVYMEPLMADLFRQLTDHYPNRKTLFGIGDSYQGLGKITQSYHEALAAFEIQSTLGQAGITYFRQIGETENQQRLRKILDYIRIHFGDPNLSLGKLAQEVNICPAYISTIFKKYQKINFSDYLVSLRMNKARELLAKTNLMTYEVAEKTGYLNPQYFSVLFKKHTGLTPTEYKNRHNPEPPG
jgi:two-component system, response regulator YesN